MINRIENINFDKLWIGLLLGLFAPFVAFSLYYLINYSYLKLAAFINYLILGNTYTPLVSLCIIVNLGVFYPFIWKEKWNGAKGVLAATFVWAALVIYLKFFT